MPALQPKVDHDAVRRKRQLEREVRVSLNAAAGVGRTDGRWSRPLGAGACRWTQNFSFQ